MLYQLVLRVLRDPSVYSMSSVHRYTGVYDVISIGIRCGIAAFVFPWSSWLIVGRLYRRLKYILLPRTRSSNLMASGSDRPAYTPPYPEPVDLFLSATAIYGVLKTSGIYYPTAHQPFKLQRMEATSSGRP